MILVGLKLHVRNVEPRKWEQLVHFQDLKLRRIQNFYGRINEMLNNAGLKDEVNYGYGVK
jgi:hypothetical protein